MKIAFVNQPFDRVIPPGQTSVGICTYGLAKALRPHCDVQVYGLSDANGGEQSFHADGITFKFFPANWRETAAYKLRGEVAKLMTPQAPVSTASWLYADYARRVAEDIRSSGFDIVHIQQSAQFAPVIRALNPKLPIALHLHAPWFSQSDYRVLAQRLQSVDLVTTVSDFVAGRIRRTFDAEDVRCQTIYNGVEASQFRAARESGRRDSRAKRILFVGAVAPHSGVHVLLDAFAKVAKSEPDAELEIVGPHVLYPLEEVVELNDWASVQALAPFYCTSPAARLTRMLKGEREVSGAGYVRWLKQQLAPSVAQRVQFTGAIRNRAELLDRYYQADLFAFAPVCNHGFGLPPIEAMAAGIPVVASESGALAETVVHGQTGLLVPKNDAPALAEGMLQLLRNDALREAMGRAARRRILERFTWDCASENLLDVYQRLLQPEGRRQLAASGRSAGQRRMQHQPV